SIASVRQRRAPGSRTGGDAPFAPRPGKPNTRKNDSLEKIPQRIQIHLERSLSPANHRHCTAHHAAYNEHGLTAHDNRQPGDLEKTLTNSTTKLYGPQEITLPRCLQSASTNIRDRSDVSHLPD